MTLKLLTEQHLEFLSLKRGYTGSSESFHVKMPHCLKSNVAAQISLHTSPVGLVGKKATHTYGIIKQLP